jgi:hypothetical protein
MLAEMLLSLTLLSTSACLRISFFISTLVTEGPPFQAEHVFSLIVMGTGTLFYDAVSVTIMYSVDENGTSE